ncbi:hypothetical protein [Bradyrhizobium sp. WD16]|uniref:hypothetical protein n=1 Tax=Bradyrhizobium sp. WD16 TaxID=1521768 RepID=UPI0020A3F3DE|nr:hypothetical protein [Bradyrhizobium sp. WD16]UTD28724.1 hypothetical protein DB459_19315 [Bradyrhizobium sp. WD16]
MNNSPSQTERRAFVAPKDVPVEGSASSVGLEPSPFACPDQNRVKPSKALLGLAAMLAISLSFYVYYHLDTWIARTVVGHHAHYAPAEDSALHETR